jgi:hypothetical protein
MQCRQAWAVTRDKDPSTSASSNLESASDTSSLFRTQFKTACMFQVNTPLAMVGYLTSHLHGRLGNESIRPLAQLVPGKISHHTRAFDKQLSLLHTAHTIIR